MRGLCRCLCRRVAMATLASEYLPPFIWCQDRMRAILCLRRAALSPMKEVPHIPIATVDGPLPVISYQEATAVGVMPYGLVWA